MTGSKRSGSRREPSRFGMLLPERRQILEWTDQSWKRISTSGYLISVYSLFINMIMYLLIFKEEEKKLFKKMVFLVRLQNSHA